MARECIAQFAPRNLQPVNLPASSSSVAESSASSSSVATEKRYYLRSQGKLIEITGILEHLDLDLSKVLGEGGQASVFAGWSLETEEEVAAKLIPYNTWPTEKKGKQMALNEITLHDVVYNTLENGVHNPHIVPFVAGFVGVGVACLTTALVKGGTVADLIEKKYERIGAPFRVVQDVTVDMAKGALHMHKCNVIHRDIKPDNTFRNKDSKGKFVFQLGDLGLGVKADDRKELKVGGTGTEGFMPDERVGVKVIKGRHGPKEAGKGDTYGIGMTGLALLLGVQGFPKKWDPETVRPEVRTKIGNRADERLLYAMIDPDVSKRLSVEEFLYRAWPSQRREMPLPNTKPKAAKRKLVEVDEVPAQDSQAPPPPQQPLQDAVDQPSSHKKAKKTQKGKENEKPAKKVLPHRMNLRAR